jgi:hypothetical protein
VPDIVTPTPTAVALSTVQGGKYVIGCPEKYGHMQKNMVKWGIPEKGIKMQLRNVELGSVGHSIQKLWAKFDFWEFHSKESMVRRAKPN